MSNANDRPAFEESGIDVRRYTAALRRSRGLMIVTILIITGGVLALSLVMTKSYNATATMVIDVEAGGITAPDVSSVQRRLTTMASLLTSSQVLNEAAEDVPGETPGSIGGAVKSSVDPEANLIDVTASHEDPQTAAAIANAVADAFVRVQADLEREGLEAAIADLEEEIADTAGDPAAQQALEDRRSELIVAEAQAGAELQVAEQAVPPGQPASPRPLRNTVLALFASTFLAVLLALGRDRLRPRVSDPRELSQLLGVPVLAGIPIVRERFGRRDHVGHVIEHEAYETLRATIQLGADPGGHVILVTSGLHGEGKTTVTARLGQSLAHAGMRTLLVSADLRWPALHRTFNLPAEPGLSDLLRLAERAGVSDHLLPATTNRIGNGRQGQGAALEVLTSGRKPPDPSRLLSSATATEFFAYLRSFDYDYILIDGPPMLGLSDTQALARHADRTLLVSRLDRITADHVMDVRDLVERLDMRPLGVVVIGARVEVSPYYLTGRPGLFSAPEVPDEVLPEEHPTA